MTTLQLKCFLSLATTKKLTDTANLFGLQVSTLSKYVDHMEDEMSVKLFQRNSGVLELTKEGGIIYPSIQFIVKEHDDLLAQLARFTVKRRTALNIALVFHQSQVLRRLTDFTDNYPDIDLTVTEATATNIQQMLDTSSVDAAIIYEELLEKKYPHSFPIRVDTLVAVVSREHPLADEKEISLAQLKDEMFFLFRGDHAMYRFQIRTCISSGFVPLESLHDLRVSTILACVSSNQGVSLLLENTINHLKKDTIAVLPLIESPTLTMSMFSPADYPSVTVEKLLKFLKSYKLP